MLSGLSLDVYSDLLGRQPNQDSLPVFVMGRDINPFWAQICDVTKRDSPWGFGVKSWPKEAIQRESQAISRPHYENCSDNLS